jgi:hypothetical protein
MFFSRLSYENKNVIFAEVRCCVLSSLRLTELFFSMRVCEPILSREALIFIQSVALLDV